MVVEENPRLLKLMRSELEKAGYAVVMASDGSSVLKEFEDRAPDLVVLDVTLTDIDGLDVCRRIRTLSITPIICLVSSANQRDRVRCFELGADDCLDRPFNINELLARVRAILRRTTHMGRLELQAPLIQGDLKIDFTQRRVMVRDQQVCLTPIEYALLCELASNAGRILPHEHLLTKIWGAACRDQVEYLWVNVRRLRQKIEPDPKTPQYIQTIPKAGYLFKPS